MQTLLNWIKSRNITSHSVAVAMLGFFSLYSGDQQFRDLVLKMAVHHPEISALLATGVSIYLKYSGAHSDDGVLKEAAALKAPKLSTDVPPASGGPK